MPNAYYHYKCPECGEELNACYTSDHLDHDETEREWVANYDCPKGCGHKEVYCTEVDDYDFYREMTISRTYAEASAWVSKTEKSS